MAQWKDVNGREYDNYSSMNNNNHSSSQNNNTDDTNQIICSFHRDFIPEIEDLYKYFETFGRVTNKIEIGHDSKKIPIAIIKFQNALSVEKVCDKGNRQKIQSEAQERTIHFRVYRTLQDFINKGSNLKNNRITSTSSYNPGPSFKQRSYYRNNHDRPQDQKRRFYHAAPSRINMSTVQNTPSNLNGCLICIDVKCAATGHGHFDLKPCRIVMVDYNTNILFDKITNVANMTDPLIEFTGLSRQRINNGVSLEFALAELHNLLIQFQTKYKNGVTIIGQSPLNDIVWCELKKGVHYSNMICLANMFRTDDHYYSLGQEAYTLLFYDMTKKTGKDYARISMRLCREYSSGGMKLENAKNKLKAMSLKKKFPDFTITTRYQRCPFLYNPNICWCGQATARMAKTAHDLAALIDKNENKSDDKMIDELKNKIQTQKEEITQLKNKNDTLNIDNKTLRESNLKLLDDQNEMKLEISDLADKYKNIKRDAIDPTKYAEWEHEDIIDWVLSLENGLFETNYGDVLRREITNAQLTGTDLIEMNINDIRGIGITVFEHRKLLKKHIQKLTHRKYAHMADAEGVNAPTAYIY